MGEHAPKKRDLLAEIFRKVHKNPFFGLFFKKNYLRRRKIDQSRVFIVIWESSENQFGRPKKMFESQHDLCSFFEGEAILRCPNQELKNSYVGPFISWKNSLNPTIYLTSNSKSSL